MHTQRDIEAFACESGFDVLVRRAPFRFIEDDKLDTCDVRHQETFGLADDPRDTRVRPVILQIADDCERVAGIADRRETNDTNVFWRRVQLSQVDKKGRIR